MEAYGSRSRMPENRRALLTAVFLWSILVLPLLLPIAVIVLTGQIGVLVLFFVLMVPAIAGMVRILPYLKDLASSPVAVEGGVVDKRTERRYLVFPGRSVLLDADYANVAARTAGAAAHISDAGSLPVMQPVNMGRSTTIVAVGGSVASSLSHEALREAREEMDANRFYLPAASFTKVTEGDQVRVWYYPITRITAGVQRYDGRLRRFVPL